MRLTKAMHAYGSTEFNAMLKTEVEQLDASQLPLQQGLTSGSHALDDGIQASILSVTEQGGQINARVGIFYRSVIAGCNCADDPTPVEPVEEYCELLFVIERATGMATVALADTEQPD